MAINFALRPSFINSAYKKRNSAPVLLERLNLELMNKKDYPMEILNQAHGEIQDQYLSIEKAKTTLNWIPRYSLEEGLRETIDWYQNFF